MDKNRNASSETLWNAYEPVTVGNDREKKSGSEHTSLHDRRAEERPHQYHYQYLYIEDEDRDDR